MKPLLLLLIQLFTDGLILLIIVDVAISYFLSPWQPFRVALDKIVNPLLTPIRKILPAIGGIDFSPVVLILLVQLAQFILVRIISAVG